MGMMLKSTVYWLITFLGFGWLGIGTTKAVAVPKIPLVDPARIQQELQEQIPVEAPSTLEEYREVQPVREGLSLPEGAKGLIIKQIRVVGNTLFSKEIGELVSQQLGVDGLPLAEVNQLILAIENLYRSRGYGLVRVVIPEQTITGDELQVEVIEGYIEDIQIEGNMKRLGRLQGYATNILQERPSRLSNLERNLLLMNELAGYQVIARLKQGVQRGGVILVLNVTQKPALGFFEVNNRGTEAVGPIRLQAGVSLNSLGGQGEQIVIAGATSLFDWEELKNIQLGFQIPLGNDGWVLSMSGNFSQTNPGGLLKPLELQGEAFNFKTGLRYALIRSARTQVNVGVSFDLTNNSSLLKLVDPPLFLYLDRTRNLELVADVNHLHPYGRVSGGLVLSQGIGGLGARERGTLNLPVSNVFGSATALKVRGRMEQFWRLPQGFNFLMLGAFQISTDALFVAEQFGIGGSTFGSAYRPSELVGDAGYALRSELQKNFVYQVGQVPFITQPYLFVDYGKVFRLKSSQFVPAQANLSSAGVGFRQSIANQTQFQLELAFPLVDINDIKAGNPNIYFSIQSSF
jgi:hemolysin activation/secretion protein